MVEEIAGLKQAIWVLIWIDVLIFLLILGMGSNLDKVNQAIREIRKILGLPDHE